MTNMSKIIMTHKFNGVEMKNFEKQIAAFNDWNPLLIAICDKVTPYEITNICEKAGISPKSIGVWKKKSIPALSTFLLFINTANEYINNRDKHNYVTEGLEL